jgi:hypothetical protein
VFDNLHTGSRVHIGSRCECMYKRNLANNTVPVGGVKSTIGTKNFNLRMCLSRLMERAGLDQFLIYKHTFYLPLFNRLVKNILK